MNLQELKELLNQDLRKELVPSHILLDNLRVIDEGSRKTAAYVDPKYLPFYYYLGKYILPTNMVEMGYGLAFFSSCFFKGCKSVKNFFAFQEKSTEYYSNKLGIKNTKSVYRNAFGYYEGYITDLKFRDYIARLKWDLCLFNEERNYENHLLSLDIIWDNLNDGGYLVMDYITAHEEAKNAFSTFCKLKNINHVIFPTRYGTGIIQKE